jgi:proteasome activator subunit 4
MLHVVRSAWGGLSTSILLPSDDAINDPYLDPTTELAILTASSVRMNAGFCVDSPEDPRYSRIIQHRDQFGSFLHRASLSLRSNSNESGEEHIDAMLAVIRAIDTFLLDYAMSRTAYASSKKLYEVTRDVVMTNSKQKHFPRSIWVRRAQVHKFSRL